MSPTGCTARGTGASLAVGAGRRSATWSDVIDEITTSCTSRVHASALWRRAGVVGVLNGAAPVVWVHGAADTNALSDVLASSSVVNEAYVSLEQAHVVAALQLCGWTTDCVVDHL